MIEGEQKIKLDKDIGTHICAISSGMVGVCLTTIGLIRVVITLNKVDTLADDFLAADAIVFLFATMSSYWAIRTRSLRRLHWLERAADISFIFGMSLMAAICVFITYAMGVH